MSEKSLLFTAKHTTSSNISLLSSVRLSSLRMRNTLALFPPTPSMNSLRKSWRNTRTWWRESSRSKKVLIAILATFSSGVKPFLHHYKALQFTLSFQRQRKPLLNLILYGFTRAQIRHHPMYIMSVWCFEVNPLGFQRLWKKWRWGDKGNLRG